MKITKMTTMPVVAGTGPLERASDVLKDLKKEIDRSGSVPPAEPPLSGQVQPSRPIPVEVRQPDPGALQVLAARRLSTPMSGSGSLLKSARTLPSIPWRKLRLTSSDKEASGPLPAQLH